MLSGTLRVLSVLALGVAANAEPAAVAEAAPEITPRAVLPRVNVQTLGWYSTSTVGVQTFYSPWTYDADVTTYTWSRTFFRRCAVGSTCVMYTGCSNGYMVAESSISTYCGAGGASGSQFCSNHVLYTKMGGTPGYSWYWCDVPPLTGYTLYAQEPAQATLPSSAVLSSAAATTSPTAGASSTTGPSAASSAPSTTTSPASANAVGGTSNTSGGSSSHTGAIAGGVVGGILALAAIAAIAFLLLRRKRKTTPKNASAPGGTTGYAPPQMVQNQGFGTSPSAGYVQPNETKPQGVGEHSQYYDPSPQQGHAQPAPYPQGPYDPHLSQQYGHGGAQPHYGTPMGSPPSAQQTTGVVPQELASGR